MASYISGEPKSWEDALDEVLAETRATMIERHLKYGPGNIAAFGELGLVVRLSDKIERLKNGIMKADPQGAPLDSHLDESIDDTYNDLSGYGLIGRMYRRGWWHLPMEEQS